jgi:amidase
MVALCLVMGVALWEGARARAPSLEQPTVVEASLADLRRAMERRQLTSRQITQQYLDRIARYDAALRAVITLNPRALEDADERDRERARGRVRGPLHGIPIALKDNIHTTTMRTTGGALAFSRLVPPYEATLTVNLRAAGAIILAKTSMTELANWVAADMPNHFNPIGGFGMNPYDPRRDPRAGGRGLGILDPGGSSSGIGTAANLWAASVGTETSGSILTPSSQTMLVGIKPTVGRVSRRGVIPITADQDTPGPMARFVADAAILLGAMESASPDPRDPATTRCVPPLGRDYTGNLDTGRLRGARIGIPRRFYYDRLDPSRRAAMAEAIAVLKRLGATVIDPADPPSVTDTDLTGNLLAWGICAAPGGGKDDDARCSVVLKYGMKRDFNRWLASLEGRGPVRTLGELRAWNRERAASGALRFGQAQLDISDEMDLEADRPRYEADRRRDVLLAATRGIDAALREDRLDALLFPGSRGSSIAARAGYPSIIVPFGVVPVRGLDALPADFESRPSPFGVTFTGAACSEPSLIGFAYAFEQATRRRMAPPEFP